MVQLNGGGGTKLSLPVATVLALVGVGVTFVGQWYVANEKALQQAELIEKLDGRVQGLASDIFTLRIETARDRQRLDNAIERVNELLRRERSELTLPPIPPR